MATTVTDFLVKLGLRLDKTISATSSPTSTQVYYVINEISEWLSILCMENESEIGRKNGIITLADGTATYDDLVDDIIAPAKSGWLLKTNSRAKIFLTTEEAILDYSPSSSAETEPDKFYMDGNGNITFLQTPDAEYTAYIPYWYHQSKINTDSYSLAGASKADPCVITFTGDHNFHDYDRMLVSGISGMTQLNGRYFTVMKESSTTVSLTGIDSTAYTTWTSGGTAYVTLPFNGIFANLYIEAASIRFQNIEEYQQEFEQSWLSFLTMEAKKVIETRKSLVRKVMR